MKKYLLSTFAIVALLFAACGGSDDAPTSVPVSGIKLDKSSLSLEIGEKATLTATIAPSDATNKSITWSSANSSIATVNNGVVEGVATGETTITAKTNDGGFTATIPVKVVTEKIPVTGISFAGILTNNNSTLKEGKFGNAFVMFTPENATNKNLTFTCDKPELVSIQEDASYLDDGFMTYKITAVKAGDVKFTAVSEDGGFTITRTMTILPTIKVSEIKIGPENATIELGETKQFAAAISPADAENREVEWSSSDPSVATIKVTNANYIAEVTGVGKGTATITATAKDGSGVKGEATITVVGKKPTSITFDGATTYAFDSWQGKVIDFKNDLKMKVEPADADLSRIELSLSIESVRDDVSGEEVKYEVKDNNITLSYAHSTNWVAPETVHATAYVDGVEMCRVNIIMQNRGILFERIGQLSDTFFEDIAIRGNKFNWSQNVTKLRFIKYYKEIAYVGKFDDYQIPNTEYTLTSSDTSKIKVTKNDDGKSWLIERLNTTDLVAVTLTYKCGEHTQTYTINLIP